MLLGGITRGEGLERRSNRNGLPFKRRVMNLWIKVRNICCELEAHRLSMPGEKELSVNQSQMPSRN